MTVVIRRSPGEPLEFAAGTPTRALQDSCANELLAILGTEGIAGSVRAYLVPHHSVMGLTNGPRSPAFALVDGIKTGLAGTPWPKSLLVNLTEDLPKKLTVDRKLVDPDQQSVAQVTQWNSQIRGRRTR